MVGELPAYSVICRGSASRPCSRPQSRTMEVGAQAATPLAQKPPLLVTLPFPQFLISECLLQEFTLSEATAPQKGTGWARSRLTTRKESLGRQGHLEQKKAFSVLLVTFSFSQQHPPFFFPFFLFLPLPLSSLPLFSLTVSGLGSPLSPAPGLKT